MKRALLTTMFVLALLFLAGCQSGWEEVHSVEVGRNDEAKQVVERFSMPDDMTVSEVTVFMKENLNHTKGGFRDYLEAQIEYNKRVDSALEKFRGRYNAECLEYLTEEGCSNVLDESIKSLFTYPEEDVRELELVDESEDKASVRMVTTKGTSVRVETYYLERTDEGWKIYDVFDYGNKKAVSDIAPEELEREHDLAVFRLRSKLEKEEFPSADFESDKCVYELTDDYVFTAETNDDALKCYKNEYLVHAKGNVNICSDIFPARYKAICYGIAFAGTDQNCSIIIDRPAYTSNKYGFLTTQDICNFYHSMELSGDDPVKARETCLRIENPRYKEKCWSMFEVESEEA